MSQQTPTGADWNTGAAPGGRARGEAREGGGLASGGTVFAAVVLMVAGLLSIFQGIAAIAKDDVYATVGDYVFEFNLTSWGWIHLVIGAVVLVTGLGLLRGMNAARVAGIMLAGLSMIANFLWLPYQPWWSMTLIALDVFVIWALCNTWSRTAH